MREDIREFNKFKTQILLCGVVFASVIGAGSLLVLGPNLEFMYGLALGTCICIVNFNILVLAGKKALAARKPVFGYAGYLLRLCVYGTAFYMALKVGVLSGIGAVLGFFTLTMAIFSIHMLKPALTGRKSKREIAQSVDPEDNSKPYNIGQDTGSATKNTKWNQSFDDEDIEKKKRGGLYRFRKEVFGYAFEDDDKESEKESEKE